MREEWRDIKGYEGLYQVSSIGRVKHLAIVKTKGTGNYARNERLCKIRTMKNGYLIVDLYKNNHRKTLLVHRIVAMAFIHNPNNYPCVNHIDSNRGNCNAENLEWCTVSYNHKYSYDTNNRRDKMNWRHGRENHNARAVLMLDKTTNEVIRRFDCIMDAERELHILNNSICSCLKGRYKTAGGFRWVYAK